MPSIGGGTKRSATFRAADGNGDGVGDEEGVCSAAGEGVSVGDDGSCAVAAAKAMSEIAIRNPISGIRNLSIVAPVHVREKIVAPFAIGEEFLIQLFGLELALQFIEASEVIESALGRVLACSSRSHEKRPIARLREQKFTR